jgi:hypothetical protein
MTAYDPWRFFGEAGFGAYRCGSRGAPWAEAKVLALAKAYERDTQWHSRRA